MQLPKSFGVVFTCLGRSRPIIDPRGRKVIGQGPVSVFHVTNSPGADVGGQQALAKLVQIGRAKKEENQCKLRQFLIDFGGFGQMTSLN